MKAMLLSVLLLDLATAAARAQSETPEVSSDEIDQLIAQLAKDGAWWEARAKLVELGKGAERMAVLRGLSRTYGLGTSETHRRAKLVADEINVAVLQKMKLREIEQKADLLREATTRAKKAATESDVRSAIAGIESALGELVASLKSERPEGVRPEYEPARRGGNTAPPAARPEAAPGIPKPGGSRTRMIEGPDGRTYVIEVPEGWEEDEVEVEFKNGALQVRRVRRAGDVKKKEEEKKQEERDGDPGLEIATDAGNGSIGPRPIR